MNPHRMSGERIEDVELLPKGPSATCPGCGATAMLVTRRIVHVNAKTEADAKIGYSNESPLPPPRACSPGRRISIGVFRRCNVDGSHLHERCKVCGNEWLSSFAGAQC